MNDPNPLPLERPGDSAETTLPRSFYRTLADGDPVTLVIPGRNVARVVGACMGAVTPLLERGDLAEIVFVDDASTDETAEVVSSHPVTVLKGQGLGPGAARNLGWRAAKTPLVWFIDADCVAAPNALSLLRPHLQEARVAAAGGSYSNMRPDSLLACLIHEEIIERHRRMGLEVNFLATFDVLYRRQILEELGGFNEKFHLAQDAELAYRIHEAGYQLRFEPGSRVGHFHPTRLRRYLKTQAWHGYYRVLLYRRHPSRLVGDHYSGLNDYVQPPLALLLAGSVALAGVAFALASPGPLRLLLLALPVFAAAALVAATLPMTLRIVARTRQPRYFWYAPLSLARSLARGLGLLRGVWGLALSRFGRGLAIERTPV